MIDTDKYEGHTQGPWLIKYGRDDSTSKYDAFIYGGKSPGKNGVLMFAATNNPYERFHPNLKLVADAPLLLEEVKRLRRVLELIGENMEYHSWMHTLIKEAIGFEKWQAKEMIE